MSDVLKQILEKKKKTGSVNPVMEKQLKGENKELREIPLDRLIENPYQPRIEIKPDEVRELAKSIEQQGLIQPVIVAKAEKLGFYYIVAGHRRTEAYKLLGKEKIKAYIIEADSKKLASMSIVENLQREDLDLIETALAIKKYKEEFGKSLEEIGNEIGKTKSWVSKILSVLNLPEKIIKDIEENKSTQDVNALNILNSFATKYKKFLTRNFFQNAEKSGDLENAISQKWENEVFELYQGFLKNGREWLKKEIENRLKQEKKPQPEIEIKMTKKHGITIKIKENLSLDEVRKKNFLNELQKLIEKYKKESE